MSRTRRSLPEDELPCYATDHQTGDVTPNPVFRHGRWWDGYRYAHHRRDLESDQQRLLNNQLLGTFMDSQSASAGL